MQCKKMIHNIGFKIADLSRAEIDARRGKPYRAQELLKQINDDIEMIEEYLLVAILVG